MTFQFPPSRKDTAIKSQVTDLLVAGSLLETTAFDLFKDNYPEYTPTRAQLKAVAFLLRRHGAEAVVEGFVQTLMRGVDPSGADKYLFGILRNQVKQRKEQTQPEKALEL